MSRQNIAIIGLGRIGSAFLGAILRQKRNFNLVCVAECSDTPAKVHAAAAGIKIAVLDEIVAMGNQIDLIFDLTGIPAVRKELCEKLYASDNNRTAIAPEEQVALKIENFHNDEDMEFRISSQRGMLSILQGMAAQGTRVALYYGKNQKLILTTLLGVNERGMWLDVSPFPQENTQLLLSDEITFVGAFQNVKIQFTGRNIENDWPGNNEAFYMELPDYLLRIQRREFFRSAIPSSPPIKCIIPVQQGSSGDPVIKRAIPLVDISGGGIALLCGEHEETLLPEKIFPDCQIAIPDVGILTATIEVRNRMNFTTPDKVIHKRVGCRFINLNEQMDKLLQRYISRLQSERVPMTRA